MTRIIYALLLVATLLVIGYCQPSHAQTYAMQDAPWVAKDLKIFPAWLDIGDSAAYKVVGAKTFLCLTDRQTGARWTSVSDVSKVAAALQSGTWTFAAYRPTLYEEQRVCWPDLPAPIAATGGPAYWSLYWKPGAVSAATIDAAWTNAAANLAGTTVKGETCGLPAKTAGYYTLPRLAKNGQTPVTRCQ